MALLVAMLAGLTNTDLTVYHVNPLHEGVIPVNMDTADLRGDIFFDLRSKVHQSSVPAIRNLRIAPPRRSLTTTW
jgi:hypothetical protein